MSHSININFNCKNKIQTEINNKLYLVNDCTNELYKRGVDDFQNFQNDREQINRGLLPNDGLIKWENDAKLFVKPSKEMFFRDFQIFKNSIISDENLYKKKFDNWNLFKLMENYKKVSDFVDLNYKKINDKLNKLPIDKSNLKIKKINNKLPLDNPLELNAKYPTSLLGFMFSFLFIVIVHIFLLIPYFKVSRNIYVEDLEEPSGAFII